MQVLTKLTKGTKHTKSLATAHHRGSSLKRNLL
jgi:hypothetical protein